ncbi:MAG: hypothetical protein EOO08_12025 [Chitinophagaceae bacterium]|nr:MAG: hypothetical protein EOO08_12025 [Chitinophagaceae bacterium]
MKRFACAGFGFALFLFSSCDKPLGERGCTDPNSFNYNPSAEESDGSCHEMAGCLGYAPGYSNSGSTGNTLYNQQWDVKFGQEIQIQQNFFRGVPAQVAILYEPSVQYKNAYANNQGQILFGYHMFYYTVQNYGELPVAGILAHEFGHRAQFTAGWQDYAKPFYRELEADAFSGFYMALAKQYAWSQIQSYYANVYAAGDYNFNSPTHHGTHEQRLQCAYLGVQTAVQAMQSGTQYTYQQLHNLFNTAIRTQIDQRRAPLALTDVRYPVLSEANRSALYPRF